jgi:hypothetical protein
VHNFKGSEVGEFTILDLDSYEMRLMGYVMALFNNPYYWIVVIVGDGGY